MLGDSVNVHDIKHCAVDHASYVPLKPCAKSTGKRVAIVGGGPDGLSTACYLQQTGHQTVVYEKRKSLGDMLRCEISNYRLSKARLDEEIEVVKTTGVEIHIDVDVGKDIAMCGLNKEFDAVYLAIGAQTDKKVGIPGEDGENVISAVTILWEISDDVIPDFRGKHVLVIDGGNVTMNVVKSSERPGVAYVGIAYRKRQGDMTTLSQEVEDAFTEGCELLPPQAPMRIELGGEQKVTTLRVRPQMTSSYHRGRPLPRQVDTEEKRIPCGIAVVATDQGIESQHFAERGTPVRHGTIGVLDHSGVENTGDIFAGRDCITGPAIVIRAIAAGEVATADIDEYLGYHHTIEYDVIIPTVNYTGRPGCGHIQLKERQTTIRNTDSRPVEYGVSNKEAQQECGRYLCYDHYGFGVFRGGRTTRQ